MMMWSGLVMGDYNTESRALTAMLWHPAYSHLQHLFFCYFTSKYNDSEFVGKAKGVVSLTAGFEKKERKILLNCMLRNNYKFDK